MTMPTVPGAGFVMVKAQFVLGGFETVFYGPAMALDGSGKKLGVTL
jgi:hypothetical protein